MFQWQVQFYAELAFMKQTFGLNHVDHNQGLYLRIGEIPSFESQIDPNLSFQLAAIVPLYLRIHWAYDYSLSYLSYLAFSTPSSYDYIVVGAGSAGQVFWSFNFCQNVEPPTHKSILRLLGGWPAGSCGPLCAFNRGRWKRS